MSGKNLKIDGKVCPNVTVIKALDTDQNKLVEFVDTSDANATSSDIITGKTAYVDGKKVIGEATAGTQPQLHAPTISKSDTIITITDSALNGDFVTGYKLYANNVLLSDQTENTADLSALITEYGNYSITAKCKGTNFQDSEASNAIEYVYEQIPSIYEVDGETLRVTNSNYVTDGGILKLL